jgi:transcriptional regulator with XRE-family HTH domain
MVQIEFKGSCRESGLVPARHLENMKKLRVATPLPTAYPQRLPLRLLATPRAPKMGRADASTSIAGARIRMLREAAHISGGSLAKSSGLSRSMLSRIERGLVRTPVETLERLAKGVGASLSHLFAEPPSRRALCHVPVGKGLRIQDFREQTCRLDKELLGYLSIGRLSIEPYLLRLPPAARECAPSESKGLKLLYLLAGNAICKCGAKSVDLRAGDTLLFDARIAHDIESVEDSSATCLCVVFSPRS